MNSGDLLEILKLTKVYPQLLPHLMFIYKLGKLRGIQQELEKNHVFLSSTIKENTWNSLKN